MTDYISRQEAINSVWRAVELDNSYAMKHQIYTNLKTIPAADVGEVVRCKDCKWYNKSGCAIYIADDTDKPTDNDYCSYAERKDE